MSEYRRASAEPRAPGLAAGRATAARTGSRWPGRVPHRRTDLIRDDSFPAPRRGRVRAPRARHRALVEALLEAALPRLMAGEHVQPSVQPGHAHGGAATVPVGRFIDEAPLVGRERRY